MLPRARRRQARVHRRFAADSAERQQKTRYRISVRRASMPEARRDMSLHDITYKHNGGESRQVRMAVVIRRHAAPKAFGAASGGACGASEGRETRG